MLSYRDMTFCPFYKDCSQASECHRPLTDEVKRRAQLWWGAPEPAPVAVFADKPDCHVLREEEA